MRGVPLNKDVSTSEMMTLRSNGKTNAEIAKLLDVAYSTVHRLIGPQPDGMRKKYERRAKALPPVGDKPIPEMPHKSFAERLEESYKKPVPVGTVKIPEKVREDIEHKLGNGVVPQQTLSHADLAREAHVKALEKTGIPYTTYKEGPGPVPELIAVFGPEAVTTWLKVSLYNMAIPECRPMNRQKMLEMLKIMNAGGANT